MVELRRVTICYLGFTYVKKLMICYSKIYEGLHRATMDIIMDLQSSDTLLRTKDAMKTTIKETVEELEEDVDQQSRQQSWGLMKGVVILY